MSVLFKQICDGFVSIILHHCDLPLSLHFEGVKNISIRWFVCAFTLSGPGLLTAVLRLNDTTKPQLSSDLQGGGGAQTDNKKLDHPE